MPPHGCDIGAYEVTVCFDSHDNDGDGFTDLDDPQCVGLGDYSEDCGLGAEVTLLLPALMWLHRRRRLH